MQVEAGSARTQLEAFRADLQKYYRVHFGTSRPPLVRRASLWATHLGLHCVAAYRLSRLARALATEHGWARLPLVNAARAVELGLELVHHVRIGAEVGPGFYVGHAGMIFIGPTRIGENFSVTHGVTVGVGQAERGRGTPVIGDGVWIGTGAVLAGAIEVGDGATVANGAMVSRNVPPRTLVGGNPARVILAGYDNAALLGDEPEGPRWKAAPEGAPPEPRAVPAVARMAAGG
jgi:serine O-acetyltransferase